MAMEKGGLRYERAIRDTARGLGKKDQERLFDFSRQNKSSPASTVSTNDIEDFLQLKRGGGRAFMSRVRREIEDGQSGLIIITNSGYGLYVSTIIEDDDDIINR